MTYKETDKPCTTCTEGTYVVYPDDVTRCRHCGAEPKVTTAGRKSNG